MSTFVYFDSLFLCVCGNALRDAHTLHSLIVGTHAQRRDTVLRDCVRPKRRSLLVQNNLQLVTLTLLNCCNNRPLLLLAFLQLIFVRSC